MTAKAAHSWAALALGDFPMSGSTSTTSVALVGNTVDLTLWPGRDRFEWAGQGLRRLMNERGGAWVWAPLVPTGAAPTRSLGQQRAGESGRQHAVGPRYEAVQSTAIRCLTRARWGGVGAALRSGSDPAAILPWCPTRGREQRLRPPRWAGESTVATSYAEPLIVRIYGGTCAQTCTRWEASSDRRARLRSRASGCRGRWGSTRAGSVKQCPLHRVCE